MKGNELNNNLNRIIDWKDKLTVVNNAISFDKTNVKIIGNNSAMGILRIYNANYFSANSWTPVGTVATGFYPTDGYYVFPAVTDLGKNSLIHITATGEIFVWTTDDYQSTVTACVSFAL